MSQGTAYIVIFAILVVVLLGIVYLFSDSLGLGMSLMVIAGFVGLIAMVLFSRRGPV